ncbi:MAG: hypothetical protein HZB13_04435 [Acidobacteria bacterium]|nr:hypothetical protein [Acidobacteriota bacterium]
MQRLPVAISRELRYWPYLLLALLNTILYAGLLPLWEGFDEGFHYAYVETLAASGRLPDPRTAGVSKAIAESFRLAPASPAVRENLPFARTYSGFFALPEEQRREIAAALRAIPPAWRNEPPLTGLKNYEAQQAPLAYLLLAPLDAWWASDPLPERVWRLRVACGIAGVLLHLGAGLALARRMGLSAGTTQMMLLLLCLPQMLYASIAHISNDWLAIGLSSWFAVRLLSFLERPAAGNALGLGVVLALGLLTKAYFLPWAALGAVALVWSVWRKRAGMAAAASLTLPVLLLAGPWYARNVMLTGSLSGTMQSASGIGFAQTARAAAELPWAKVAPMLARSAVWTGNSSFTTFSEATVHLHLLLLAAALACWVGARGKGFGEAWLGSAPVVYAGTLLYACAVFYAYRPGVISISPWYTPAMHLPLAALAALGLERAGAAGRWLAIAVASLGVYLLAATYVLKLIPLYAGCEMARVDWGALRACYQAPGLGARLGQNSLAAPWATGLTTGMVLMLLGWGWISVLRRRSGE